MSEHLSQFHRELDGLGLEVKRLVADGKIHRCHDCHSRKRNDAGWYWVSILPSGHVKGVAGSWRDEQRRLEYSSYDDERTLTRADLEAIRQVKENAERQKQARHEAAAFKARRMLTEASSCVSHPYLASKGVPSHGLKVDRYNNLLVPVTTPEGEVRSVQMIAPEKDADGKDKLFLKGTDRDQTGFWIKGTGNIIAVVEGYATGASVHEATGWPVWGGYDAGGVERTAIAIRTLVGPDITLLFCGDRDPVEKGERGQRAARKAASLTGGQVALPPVDGDWNDYHAAHGLAATTEALLSHVPDAPVSLDLGQATMSAALETFIFEECAEWQEGDQPPAGVFKATTGAGKTFHTHSHLPGFINATGKGVVITVPAHKLADEQAERIAARTGLRVEVWRGMGQPDPEDKTELMCRDYDLVKEGFKADIPLAEMCKVCPLHTECAYQKQHHKTADVWLVPHEMLFRPMPKAFGEIGMVIIDEDISGTALQKGSQISVHALEGVTPPLMHKDDIAYLKGRRTQLLNALSVASERRELRRSDLDGLTAEICDEAYSMENKRGSFQMPKGDREKRLEAIKNFKGRLPSKKIALLWKLVRDLLESGQEHCPTIEINPFHSLGKEGTCRYSYMSYRREISEDWQLPTVYLDATANMRVISEMLPHAELKVDVKIAAPHQHITRITEKSFSLTSLSPNKAKTDKEKNTRWNTLKKLHQTIEWLAAIYAPKSVGVICNLSVEILLEELGPLPSNVIIDHFNNVTGRNDWEDCGAFLIVGRTKPDIRTMMRDARAFTGRWDCPDLVQAMEFQVCEAELMQSIGRARGVRRTAKDPVDIYIANDIPLPVDVERTVTWSDFQPGASELMAARGLVLDADTSTRGYWKVMAAMVPDIHQTAKAAKDAHYKREGCKFDENSNKDIYNGTFVKLAHDGYLPMWARSDGFGWVPVLVDLEKVNDVGNVVELATKPPRNPATRLSASVPVEKPAPRPIVIPDPVPGIDREAIRRNAEIKWGITLPRPEPPR